MLRACVFAVLLFALFAIACGKTEEKPSTETQPPSIDMTAETAYGSVSEVSGYLQIINPHINTFSELQRQYEDALASSKQGSSDRRGTGRNLATKAAAVRPGLQSVLEELDSIEPPPLLAPFHRDTRKMLVTVSKPLHAPSRAGRSNRPAVISKPSIRTPRPSTSPPTNSSYN